MEFLSVVDHVDMHERFAGELGVVFALIVIRKSIDVANARMRRDRKRCVQRAHLESVAAKITPGERLANRPRAHVEPHRASEANRAS